MFAEGSICSPQEAVRKAFLASLQKSFPGVDHQPVVALSNPKFGDYQCNSAMPLFKQQQSSVDLPNPGAIGNRLKENLPTYIFSEATVAPQGFVTVKLQNDWIADQLRPFVRSEIRCKANQCEKCLVDFSSPNIAKEMHVGHLRSSIIGESLCRILEFVGYSVERVNHLGDWGTQFGMLIEYMRETYPDFQSDPPALSDLNEFYKASKQRFDADPVFKKRAQRNVVELQSGEDFARSAWKLFCDISRTEFQKIYDRLDVQLKDVGESYYNDMIPNVVDELTRKGLIIESMGAKCFFVEQDPEKREKEVPMMVVKSDGGYGYDSTDLAAVRYRLAKADVIYYVTDLGQENHFMSLFKAAELAGWHVPPKSRLVHVGFGVIQGDDGKKFKTRSGEVVKLSSLLDEAVIRALKEIESRRSTETPETPENDVGGDGAEEPEAAARKIGYSAVKYFDLKQNRTTAYKFSYEKMLDPKGNTAVYLLYAYARICAIFRKAGVNAADLCPTNLCIAEPEERLLALTLLRLPEVISSILEDVGIHRLADLIYEISTNFTAFYQKCRVIGSPEQNSRLLLCELTRKTLQKCFYLLGIQTLERI